MKQARLTQEEAESGIISIQAINLTKIDCIPDPLLTYTIKEFQGLVDGYIYLERVKLIIRINLN